MSATNIIVFKADLAKFAEKIDVAKGLVVQKVAIDLWTSITRGTPVDTGRARANWFLTEGAPSSEVHPHEGAKPNSVPEPAVPDVSGITGENPVFIINNLPYIEALEHGHSRQAPSGMVQVAMQRAENRIARAIAAAVHEAGI